ncbi:MAG: hypothetical protein ACLFQV_04545, partial [Vulcanimicrobiota bacterium]
EDEEKARLKAQAAEESKAREAEKAEMKKNQPELPVNPAASIVAGNAQAKMENILSKTRPSARDIIIDETLPLEERFLHALRREFRIIRERGDYKLSEAVLKRMQLVESDPGVPISYVKGHEKLFINIKNPTVEKIIKGFEEEPQLLYYMISMIYSTINKILLDVTDDDEMRFQMVMLENLLAHPALN